MQSAATVNERGGLVGYHDVTDVTGDRGVTVTTTNYTSTRIIIESVAGQTVQAQITIGKALEAVAANTAGNKPVDQSDAAAIQAAEVRATGSNVIIAGGVAASFNAGLEGDEDKIKLADVLTGATGRLATGKAATRDDAEEVTAAELRINPNLATHPGGVASSVAAAAAARLNEGAL